MATVTFVEADGLPAEWIVPAKVHSIRVKIRSGGAAAPGAGGMGGHYFELTCAVVPGRTVEIYAAGAAIPDSAETQGGSSQVVFATDGGTSFYGHLTVVGGYTYAWGEDGAPDSGAATADDPDPHNGYPYFYIEGETRLFGRASTLLYASDYKFYRGGLGVTNGGGGSGANSTGPGVDAVGGTGAASGGDGGAGGNTGLAGSFPGGGAGSANSGGDTGGAGSVTFEYFTSHGEDEMAYFGRLQQGMELIIVLQCTDDYGTPEDPSALPWVQIYRDAATPELLTSKQMPAEARRVEDGIFRLSLFLDTLYSTEGRYLVLMKWLDSNGVAHVRTGSFHLLPGGNPDGAVISMYSLIRQDATYLLMQCDSGRLIRKRNPR